MNPRVYYVKASSNNVFPQRQIPRLHEEFQIDSNLNECPLPQQPADQQSNSISSLPVTKSLETPTRKWAEKPAKTLQAPPKAQKRW